MLLIKSILPLNKEIKFDMSFMGGSLFLQIPFLALSLSTEVIKDE